MKYARLDPTKSLISQRESYKLVRGQLICWRDKNMSRWNHLLISNKFDQISTFSGLEAVWINRSSEIKQVYIKLNLSLVYGFPGSNTTILNKAKWMYIIANSFGIFFCFIYFVFVIIVVKVSCVIRSSIWTYNNKIVKVSPVKRVSFLECFCTYSL